MPSPGKSGKGGSLAGKVCNRITREFS